MQIEKRRKAITMEFLDLVLDYVHLAVLNCNNYPGLSDEDMASMALSENGRIINGLTGVIAAWGGLED